MSLIVYVESNFVVEIALAQEQAKAANEIITLAENNQIELVFPAFAINEPVWAVSNRVKQLKNWLTSLTEMQNTLLTQLQRSEIYRQRVSSFQPLAIGSGSMGQEEEKLLVSTINRLLKAGKAIQTDEANFSNAVNYRTNLDLELQDAIVYAVVFSDLQTRQLHDVKCFLGRDKRAFFKPSIKTELESLNCQYIDGFENGLSFINSNLGGSAPPAPAPQGNA